VSRLTRTFTVATAALLLASVGCDKVAGSASGCTKDSDCKGARVCSAGACVDPPERASSSPLASSPPAPTPTPNAAVSESTAGPAERQQWWIAGPLSGNDNSAAAMKGARISGQNPYTIHIDNQFGFTCSLDFDDSGRPARLYGCSGSDGWRWGRASIALRCAVNAQTKYEVCSGSTGGVISSDGSNTGFDGMSIARRLH
jgi:hypothetical protein